MCGTILERRTSPDSTLCFVEPIALAATTSGCPRSKTYAISTSYNHRWVDARYWCLISSTQCRYTLLSNTLIEPPCGVPSSFGCSFSSSRTLAFSQRRIKLIRRGVSYSMFAKAEHPFVAQAPEKGLQVRFQHPFHF